jgi:hypothetical protein
VSSVFSLHLHYSKFAAAFPELSQQEQRTMLTRELEALRVQGKAKTWMDAATVDARRHMKETSKAAVAAASRKRRETATKAAKTAVRSVRQARNGRGAEGPDDAWSTLRKAVARATSMPVVPMIGHKKSPFAPKYPINAYNFYLIVHRRRIASKFQGRPYKELSEITAAGWRNISEVRIQHVACHFHLLIVFPF